jgi:hypothetical protein
MQGGYGQTHLAKYLQKLRRKMRGVKVLVARTVGCGYFRRKIERVCLFPIVCSIVAELI